MTYWPIGENAFFTRYPAQRFSRGYWNYIVGVCGKRSKSRTERRTYLAIRLPSPEYFAWASAMMIMLPESKGSE